jgi:septum formation protein
MNKKQIILASSSPFRKKILEQTGLDFKVIKPDYNENMNITDTPEELVKVLSEGKAENVESMIDYNAVIISSDQIFVFENQLGGKVRTRKEAFERLKRLSGRMHRLISGLTVLDTEKQVIQSITDIVNIYMRALTTEEINSYLDTGEWKEVAGSYRIEGQGVKLIESIEGDYFSVIGLPVFKLLTMLRNMEIPIF